MVKMTTPDHPAGGSCSGFNTDQVEAGVCLVCPTYQSYQSWARVTKFVTRGQLCRISTQLVSIGRTADQRASVVLTPFEFFADRRKTPANASRRREAFLSEPVRTPRAFHGQP